MITFDTKTFNKLSNDYRAYQIKLRDADNDGLLDILAVYGEQNGLKWMKQLPNNRMDGGPVDLVTIDKPDSFDVHDINNDGIPDIVIHSSTSIYLYPGKE